MRTLTVAPRQPERRYGLHDMAQCLQKSLQKRWFAVELEHTEKRDG